jgi:seryl-tRNA synthetase
MLDIRLIRERTDFVKSELTKVGFDVAAIDTLLSCDVRRRALIQEVESLRARRGEVSRTIGRQDPAARQQVVADMRALGDRGTKPS